MATDVNSQIKRFVKTAQTYQKKGQREWAKAKNGQGGEHYTKAKDAFERAKRNQAKADELRRK